MGNLKSYLINLCVSFTAVLFILSLVNDSDGLNGKLIQLLFVLCVLVEILMFFTDKIPVRSLWASCVINILDICIVVLPIGAWRGLFPVTPFGLLLAFLIILATFFIVLGMTLLKDQIDISQINKKLRQRKNKEDQDHEPHS